MSSQDKRLKRVPRTVEVEEYEDEFPVHRPQVERDERSEYEEWRKERGGRGRKRRSHRDQEHFRKDDDLI